MSDAAEERERPFPTSLCHRCVHHRYVVTKTSTFIRCAIPEIKYCSQPVRACELFEPSPEPSSEPDGQDPDGSYTAR